MSTLKPLSDRLLVTPYRRHTQWDGRIILNEKQRHILMGQDHVFWVLAVGPKVRDVKSKDRVVCRFDHDGLEMLTDGTQRGFIRADQVLAVLPFEEWSEPQSSPA